MLTNEMIYLVQKKVMFLASKYSYCNNIDDLYQAGMMGVVKASKKYDETMNVKFSSFCEKYIIGEIFDFIRKDKNIKVSRDFIRLRKKVNIAINRYFDLKKTYPTIEDLSCILNESKDKIIEVLNINQNVKSLDESINNEDDILLKDTIKQEDNIDLIDLISLNSALDDLNVEDRNLIEQRYYNGKTQTELATELNMSQVKIYRKEKKILNELNEKMTA